jgi:hypothetical protein
MKTTKCIGAATLMFMLAANVSAQAGDAKVNAIIMFSGGEKWAGRNTSMSRGRPANEGAALLNVLVQGIPGPDHRPCVDVSPCIPKDAIHPKSLKVVSDGALSTKASARLR